ncbi:hypothetical protein AJ79_09869 [Helicocarpus griseus UAMH5409]|uniref:D-xylose reductase [NAD(P)H] n=1 Tax=Helicocarpus griseus UAMH5409 TaxID=1447875 RepID=A0A2B7WGV4_9EURO|nr:hypothetical protein AJ79_09869 [Helicocarpus griseus UAMH5409]
MIETPIVTKTFKLSDGTDIPAVGFGGMEYGMIFPDDQKARVIETLKQALQAGYRLIDTARIYNTEDLVGAAIRASGIPRSEITVITKLVQAHHDDPETSFNESLAKLDVDYIDIYLMHWPNALGADGQYKAIDQSPTFVETWKKMEKLVGPRCRGLGVCNFSQKTMDVLLKECTIKPLVNQVEVHPYNPSLELVPYCLEKGIRVLSWGPVCGGPKSLYFDTSAMFNHPILTSVASRYNISVGLVILSWLVQRGLVPIPHSASPTRMAENLRPVALTGEEVEQINNMHKHIGQKRLMDSVGIFWGETPGKGKTLMGWTVQEMGWEDAEGKVLI